MAISRNLRFRNESRTHDDAVDDDDLGPEFDVEEEGTRARANGAHTYACVSKM